jgi:hypothetical protein
MSFFVQRIEDVRSLAGQTVTVSFWAKAAANYSLGVGDLYFFQVFGTGGSTGVATGISSATTITTSWQRYSYTVTLPSVSGKTIGANSYVEMSFGLQTSTSTFTLDIWGVQLEAGSVATPFRRNAPSLQAELAACQRYYYRIGPFGATRSLILGQVFNTTLAGYYPTFKVPMRAEPVADFSAASLFTGTTAGGGATAAASTVGISTSTSEGAQVNLGWAAAQGVTAGHANVMIISTGGYLGFTAEL